MGYNEDYAYCLWDPDKQKVVISWDVVFDESGILTSDYTPPNDNEVEWEVDAIIDESLINGVPHYKVKWNGYGNDDCTWEPLEHVEHLDTYKEWTKENVKRVFLAVTNEEPKTYAKALEGPDAVQWAERVASKLASLAKNYI